jgi:hypothetical protein
MAEVNSPGGRSITDSPWYWLYLFCTAALIALFLAQTKFAARQSQIERKAQGRQRAIQNISGKEPRTPLSDVQRTHIRLWPLFVVLGLILLGAWGHLIWKHFSRNRS